MTVDGMAWHVVGTFSRPSVKELCMEANEVTEREHS